MHNSVFNMFEIIMVGVFAMGLLNHLLSKHKERSEKSSLTELVHRFSVIEEVDEQALAIIVNKAITKRTPEKQYERIVEKSARSLRCREDAERRRIEYEARFNNDDED